MCFSFTRLDGPRWKVFEIVQHLFLHSAFAESPSRLTEAPELTAKTASWLRPASPSPRTSAYILEIHLCPEEAEHRWLYSIYHSGLIIDGKKVYNEQTKVVLNPSTEEVIARVPIATHPQLDETVHAASKAFPTWSRTPIQERQQAVAKMGALLQEHLAGFIELLMKEVGKARELA